MSFILLHPVENFKKTKRKGLTYVFLVVSYVSTVFLVETPIFRPPACRGYPRHRPSYRHLRLEHAGAQTEVGPAGAHTSQQSKNIK